MILNNIEHDCEKFVPADYETAVDEKTVESVKFSAENYCEDDTNVMASQLDCSINNISINQELKVCWQGEIKATKFSENVLAAPDGGWGWVIVGCAFCITAIVGGSYTAFSLLYMEFTSVFDTSKAVAGWIGSIYMATGQFLGMTLYVIIIISTFRSSQLFTNRGETIDDLCNVMEIEDDRVGSKSTNRGSICIKKYCFFRQNRKNCW